MTTAIKVENLSKAYQLGSIGTGTISRDIHRWLTTKILGKEDPFQKIGETNDRSTKGTSDIVWSLKDINFSIEQGDAVGIIGKNGAGKSTLLKLLSRVTAPTTGNIKVKGRVASLLEVGTGFHPELTGRENIYLNGAILGMRKKEITRKMDEIVAFSGVERYIDTPVKRYSSGMYVRLAFAVAAHLESEILIVDEVLAVGDAEFQKKCLGKMGEVSKGEGRTVLFVSHNMAAIRKITRNSILLKHGQVQALGETPGIIDKYLTISNSRHYIRENISELKSEIIDIRLINDSNQYDLSEDISIRIVYSCKQKNQRLSLSLALFDIEQNYVLNSPSGTTENLWSVKEHHSGLFEAIVTIKGGLLNNGVFNVIVMLVENGQRVIDEIKDEIFIDLYDKKLESGFTGFWGGVVRPKLNWTINAINASH